MTDHIKAYAGYEVARIAALTAKQTTYASERPCIALGHTLRYAVSGACHPCSIVYHRKLHKETHVPKGLGSKHPRTVARKAGALTYTPANPCPRNHDSKRFVNTAKCIQCQSEANQVYKRENAETAAAYMVIWRAKNLDPMEVSIANAKYRKQNHEAILLREARFRARTVEQRKADSLARYWRTPEKHRARARGWAIANPLRAKAKDKAYRIAHPEICKAQASRRRVRLKGGEGSHTGHEIKVLFIKQKGRCAYCFIKLIGKYHKDHYIAVSRGGTDWISNIRLACGPCNSKKWATDALVFIRRKFNRLL